MRARFTPMNAVRDHRVAVLVLEGAKALDVGIAAHVFAKRPSMPYEVRVCRRTGRHGRRMERTGLRRQP